MNRSSPLQRSTEKQLWDLVPSSDPDFNASQQIQQYLEAIEKQEYQAFLEELESIRRQEEIARNNRLLQAPYREIKSSVFKMTVSLGRLFESVAELVSLALDFVPIIGQIKGVAEAIIGRDLITGEELEDWERGLEAILLFLPFAKALPFAQRAFATGGKIAGAVNQAARQELRKLAAIAHQLQRAKNIDPRQVYQLTKRIIDIPKKSLRIGIRIARIAARTPINEQLLPRYVTDALRDIQKALSDIPAVRIARKSSKGSKSVASGKKSTKPPASTRGTTDTNDPRGTQNRGTQDRAVTRSPDTQQDSVSSSRMTSGGIRSGASIRMGSSNTLVGTNGGIFRRDAERIIRDTPNHPLNFLLDENGKFKRTKGLDELELADQNDLVQMGHVVSKRSGEPELLVLQDAFLNQLQKTTIEHPSKGAYAIRNAVDLGGIGVDLETARIWEREGKLPLGITVDTAPKLKF